MSASYRQGMPQPTAPFPYVQVSGTKGLEGGTSHFIMAFGKLSEGEEVWKNSDPFADTAPFPKNYCQFWMFEKGDADEKNKFVRWIWTGKNDPVHVLGLDTAKQDPERLRQIYGDKASKYPVAMPEEEFVLPVFQVERKPKAKGRDAYDLASGVAKLLIVRKNMLFDIIAACDPLKDQPDSAAWGHVLEINKNLADKDPKKKYQFSVGIFDPFDLSSRQEEIDAMYEKAGGDIDKVFKEANGEAYGEQGAKNVWGYLLTHFGGTKEQLIEKYSVKGGPAITLENIEEIELG